MRHLLWTGFWLALLSRSVFSVSKDFVPLQEKAMGHSLTGASLNNDSLYGNPASSGFTKVYSVDGIFQLPKTFAVSILDTKTSALGGGIGYYRRTYGGTKDVTQGLRLGFSGRVTDTLAIGMTGKMIWGPTSVLDSKNNPVPGQITNIKDKYYGLDTGVLYEGGMYQLGTSFHNVTSEKLEMGERREVSAGGRLNWQKVFYVSAAAQSLLSDVTPYEYSVGTEYVSPYFFGLKAGFRIQPYQANSFWSFGASFLSPRLSLHYVVELPNQKSIEMEHMFGATILM